jgi:DNA-binding transcriptional regulator LsrR (DeoR family)
MNQVNTFVVKGFVERLKALMDARDISQSQLAQVLGVSRSTVTGWVRYGKLPDALLLAKLCDELHVSSDHLLGLNTRPHKQNPSGRIHWTEEIPPHIDGVQREQIADGIRIFNAFVSENRSAADLRARYNGQYLRLSLLAALRSGAIRLTHVARDDALEAKLKHRYPSLKEVVVAHVHENYDDSIIRTEAVAFLAANEVLRRVNRPNAVGLGSGYTMLRTCELSVPSVDQFSGTRWLPLLAFAKHNTSDYTANDLARLMSIRHPGSIAGYLPHPDECCTDHLKLMAQETQRSLHNTPLMLMSVSGVDRRDRVGSAHVFTEFRSADYEAEAPDLRSEYAELDDKAQFGAELLRMLLDTRGNILSRDPATGGQVDLDVLRYHTDVMDSVCIVAACGYKAKAVKTCVENRLANVLVIDSEIAEYLT